ncbi:hypothetical protein SLE2022_330640 [Rubroshorea leprosula]
MGSVIFAMVALMIMFLVSMLLQLFWVVFQWPYCLTERLKKQGIIGPPYKLLIGFLNDMRRMKKTTREMILDSNSKDVVQKVLPHYHIYMVLGMWSVSSFLYLPQVC